VALAFLVFCTLFLVMSSGEGKITVYFYSSETSINNFKSLKIEFDRYLSRYGPYELQPFSSRKDFENHIKDKTNCLLLLSSWHYRHIHKTFSLTPILCGHRKDRKYQKRILVAGGLTRDIKTLRTARIASASNLEHTISVLTDMLKGKYSGEPFRILTVPKDIDALMSVGFGMAGFALSTGNSLEELRTVNPALCSKISILAEGEQSLLMVLAATTGSNQDAEKVSKILQDMAADPEGKRRIRMLGLDGWQPIDPVDRQKLES
jgi:hypothetical protein